MKRRVAAVGLLCLLLGCRKDINNKEAVQRAMMEYLAKRTDLVSMDVNVSAVSFRDDQAFATVQFRAKGSTDTANSMKMAYVLNRDGNRWVVKGRPASGNPHGGSGGMPMQGSPRGGDMPVMPPGHPAIPNPSGSPK